MSNNLIQLTYTSKSELPEPFIDGVIEIVNTARSVNPGLGITGALITRDGMFIQVLEGPSENVRPLFEKISHDPRHSNVIKVLSEQVDQRLFPDWSMAYPKISLENIDIAKSAFAAAIANNRDAVPAIKKLMKLVASAKIIEEKT